jgi:hypothetical protein
MGEEEKIFRYLLMPGGEDAAGDEASREALPGLDGACPKDESHGTHVNVRAPQFLGGRDGVQMHLAAGGFFRAPLPFGIGVILPANGAKVPVPGVAGLFHHTAFFVQNRYDGAGGLLIAVDHAACLKQNGLNLTADYNIGIYRMYATVHKFLSLR